MTDTPLLDEKLEPCPFCLNELARVRDYDGDPLYAHPDSENCVLSGTSWDADQFDIAAWNRRALPTRPPASAVTISDIGKLLWECERIAGDMLTRHRQDARQDAETIRKLIDCAAALSTRPATEVKAEEAQP